MARVSASIAALDGLDERAASDWSSGPPAIVVTACGHVIEYRPPSPARGDVITCGRCGRPTVVERPVRRTDRHGPAIPNAELRQ